jgi:two-component system cell cycle response regulator
VSGSVDDELMRRGFASGVVDFLRKPIDPALLTKSALTAVGRNSRPPRLGRALVLEDTVTVASVIAKLMGELGMSCTQCRTVAEFETWLSIAVPDLITLDLSLPDGNGLAICRSLRQNRALDQVPVVIVSGTTDRDVMVECLKAGANDYLEKPFVRDEFLARLSNLMRAKQLQDELSQKNRMLENLAYHDTLTGLLNRRSLDEGLAREVNRAERKKEPLACILIDLDNFKLVNDAHGHDVGDAVLREVAAIVRTSVRGYDLPCRYGGEELCVLLPGSSVENAARLAERLRSLCEQTPMSRLGLRQTVSIGVTAYPHPSSADAIIADADRAMYEAKRLGRNAVRIVRDEF